MPICRICLLGKRELLANGNAVVCYTCAATQYGVSEERFRAILKAQQERQAVALERQTSARKREMEGQS